MMIVVMMIKLAMMIVIVDEFESPSYDDLVKLLNQHIKIIRKTRAKNEKLELKKDSLLAKCDIAEKASVEIREENKTVIQT